MPVQNTHSMVTRGKNGIQKPKVFQSVTTLSAADVPLSVAEALQSPTWKNAMQAEFDALQRPVIAVDATHLKSKTRGVLLVAVCKDGNEMICPLAFGFANSECSKSWTWFLKQLHDVILHPELVMIVSDRHTCISNGMRAIFPNAAHVVCAYHLANNLKQHCRKRGDVIYHYYRAAYAYRVEKFDRCYR
ncbi:hypothetical protein LWI29_024757 [Acer saccharum]|uniref:MULE transposase domain-containing protein n=1 Tax=Acer saccharum TaxID=4024 RepID=A0AA39TGG4_ACESA|nr:hypothetical protein LWI29_024757 [Acer saccharum]